MYPIRLPRLARVAAAAVGGVLATMAFAAPAFADDVDVQMGGLSSAVLAGGRSDGFSVTLRNNTEQPIAGVRRAFVVQLPGLTADGVRITRGFGDALPSESANPGEVRLFDPQDADLGGRRQRTNTREFRIEFTSASPGGEATVTVVAFVGQTVLGRDSDRVQVRGAPGAPTSTPKTSSAPATSAPPATTGPTVSLAPLGGNPTPATAAANEGGAPVILYVLGAILVAAGGGILWLLFRGPRPALVDAGPPTAEHPVVRPLSLGYPAPTPRAAHPPRPTTVMPTMPDPYIAPPPVDPWPTDPGRPRPPRP